MEGLLLLFVYMRRYHGYAQTATMSVHSMCLVPLGFLVVFRTSQAYQRYQHGVDCFTDLLINANELVRRTCTILTDDIGAGWPPASKDMAKEQHTCSDPQRQILIRHTLLFFSAGRNNLRKRRLDPKQMKPSELSIYMTQEETKQVETMCTANENFNSPVIIARWLSQDIMALHKRLTGQPLHAAMESNLSHMVRAWREIDMISYHAVPWPYTHLSQLFLVLWIYSFPLPLINA